MLITVIAVRGHAPRDAGAKMVVGSSRTWGSIGGGNLEEVAITRARTMITEAAAEVITETTRLNPHERTEFGRQCCGGEVTVLFEPLPARPTIAIFGVGHVGFEIARIVARWDVRLAAGRLAGRRARPAAAGGDHRRRRRRRPSTGPCSARPSWNDCPPAPTC